MNLEDFALKFFFVSKESHIDNHILVENCGESAVSPRSDLNIFFSLDNQASLFEVLNTTGTVTMSHFESMFSKHPKRMASFFIVNKGMKISDVLLRHFSDWGSIERYYGIIEDTPVMEEESSFMKFWQSLDKEEPEKTDSDDTSDIVIEMGGDEEDIVEERSEQSPQEETSEETVDPVIKEPSTQDQVAATTDIPSPAQSSSPSSVTSNSIPDAAILEFLKKGNLQHHTVKDMELAFLPQMLNIVQTLASKFQFDPDERLTSENIEDFTIVARDYPAEEFRDITLKVLMTCWRFGHRDFVTAFVNQFFEIEGESRR